MHIIIIAVLFFLLLFGRIFVWFHDDDDDGEGDAKGKDIDDDDEDNVIHDSQGLPSVKRTRRSRSSRRTSRVDDNYDDDGSVSSHHNQQLMGLTIRFRDEEDGEEE
jgi:hypothetical protein